MPIKILIADGYRILRESIRGMLELQENFQVVGEIADGRDAVEIVEHLKPDVIIIDVSKDVANGIETVRQLTDLVSDVRIVVLSTHEDEYGVREILGLNPDAYLSKESAFSELLHAVKMVRLGKKYLCTNISTILMKDYMRQLDPGATLQVSELSFRQKQVLQFVAEGKTTKDIAQTLGLSEYTVENQ